MACLSLQSIYIHSNNKIKLQKREEKKKDPFKKMMLCCKYDARFYSLFRSKLFFCINIKMTS